MNGWTYACLVVGLLFLAAPAGALIPDDITLSTDTPWLTAGSGGTSTVMVLVTNGTSASPVSGAVVDLAVDAEYGSISPVRVETDSAGRAAATFRPGTLSGTTTITATVSEGVDEPLTGSVEQQIDHATAHKVVNLWYEPEVTVGETTDIVIRMVDKYGNVVDSRQEDAVGSDPEKVFFMVGSPAAFSLASGSRTRELSVPVDAAGNVTATLWVGKVAGENLVSIYPPAPIVRDMISITGVGGLPADIKCSVSDISVPADGENTISFNYMLLDEYGNPTAGQGLWVNSSGLYSQQELIYSSFSGEVYVTYGPENNVGIATITATALENSSVTNTTRVEFVSTEAVKMVVSASPQTMASRDCNPNVVSELRAKVMDIKGNPVDGETVTFTIDTSSMTISGATPDGNPYLGETVGQNETTAVTQDGSATVKFHPGAFVKPVGKDKASAKGNVTVRATWINGTRKASQDIELTWVNYPYLSVETEVSNPKVSVNSTEEDATNMTYVTIRLKGDGYAMQPVPIDVMLVIDRSGSMKGQRLADAKSAAKTFVGKMDSSRDMIGLVSYSTDASPNQPLTDSYSTVNNSIDSLNANGWTATRKALYVAIKEVITNSRSDAIPAVILMTDGEYNYYGDPLARGEGRDKYDWTDTRTDRYTFFEGLGGSKEADGGLHTNQNMSVYANNSDNDIRLYTISFSNGIEEGSTTQKTLDTLAKATGGKYHHAPDGVALAKIYTEIAGELQNEASVDTNMTVFKNVEVNGTPIAAYTVFDYKYEPGKSTTIRGWVDNGTHYPDIPPFTTIDQTKNWTTDRQLHFDIGTIQLGQTWEATFCLAVNASYEAGEENNINIFGPGATISFNNGTGTENLDLPDTYVTVFPDLTHAELNTSLLAVEFTGPASDSGPYTDLVPLTWNTTYRGTEGVDVSLAYSRYDDMRSPTHLLTRSLGPGRFVTVDNTTADSTQMDVKGLAPGEYWITVTALARDAETAEDTINVWAHTRGAPKAYIKIE